MAFCQRLGKWSFQPPLQLRREGIYSHGWSTVGALGRAAVVVRCWCDMVDLLYLDITNTFVANYIVSMISWLRSQEPVGLEGQ